MPCNCKNLIEPSVSAPPTPPEPGFVRCCDCNGCCKDFCQKNRDPYWPKFSRPRWMPCCELYDFHGCGECTTEDKCKKYDPCKNKKREHPPKPPVPPRPKPCHCCK